MSLDSEVSLHYTDSDSEGTASRPRADVGNVGGFSMIMFLSFPNREQKYQNVAEILKRRGFTVLTNFDRAGLEGGSRKTDLRLARIRRSDVFVFFASDNSKDQWSPLRQVEFGYALGCELPVAFVGRPFNSLHSYGDVFRDLDEFLAEWYSEEYYERMAEWFAEGHGTTQVA